MDKTPDSTAAEDHADKIAVERPAEHVALIRFSRLAKYLCRFCDLPCVH
jgi:hypothetical protein